MAGSIWRFADCEFDEMRRELRVRGVVVDIEGKPLDVLRELLRHAGEVVTKEELLEAAWPGVMVVDGSLATAVSKLRKALGSDDVIVTLPRVGYRLAAPVSRQGVDALALPDLRLAEGAPVPGRDQWRLVRRLDLTPSSEVWLAEHPKTRQTRVFKFAPGADQLPALKREVTVSRLLRESFGDRPDFVRVLEWNFERPPYFVESEHAGLNLAEWAATQGGLAAVPLDVRVRLLADAARAVAAAHGLDILHKDLKPANILVSAGGSGVPQVRISDFGSAALLAASRLDALGITRLGFTQAIDGDAGALSGTALYVAPEVLTGQSPTPASDVYALGLLLYQLVVGDLRRPLTAGWEEGVADPLLREDIAAAANGDPARRLTSASALADRLSALAARRAAHEVSARAAEQARTQAERRDAARGRRTWVALAAAVALVVAAGGAYLTRRAPPSAQLVKTVAVLPLRNLDGGGAADYLRVALADEAATILSHTRGVAVRPFAAAGRVAQVPVDLLAVGRDMGVDSVLTGHFRDAAGRLAVTLEAIDVQTGRLLWRDSFDGPAGSMMAVQVQLALRIRGGLAPALGALPVGMPAEPRNEQAYALFLRSTAFASDQGPNREAIALLDRSLQLDPSYAPAWQALSKRSYMEAQYGGDPALMRRGEQAAERAVSLDPDYIVPAAGLVVWRVERGDLAGAFTRATDLVRRRPESVDTQFSLSYVYRYAGLLDDAARHCEAAFLLDPRNSTSGLRSCAVVFLQRGDYVRAANYLHLDEGSDFEKVWTLHGLVRQGDIGRAKRLAASGLPQWGSWSMLAACLQQRPAAEVAAMASALEPSPDPETNYFSAVHLAYCGHAPAAASMLTRAIDGRYCAYPALESEPLLAALRARPEFPAIRTSAIACQRRFLAATSQEAS